MIGFFLGLAGSSFSVGVAFVSPWFPAARQGGALGVYGMGNTRTVDCGVLWPRARADTRMAGRVSRDVRLARGVGARVCGARAECAQSSGREDVWRDAHGAHHQASQLGALVLFLTFGGFVAFSIYLPTLLKDQFGLSPADAGFRTAGFVVLATMCRPAGGWLADRIGGARVLNGVFLGVIPFALLMAWPSMLPFSVGALGCAALLGFGNGAVFKLVPGSFPAETGTVTGLVGAMGGLGGFFPPLLLGAFYATGSARCGRPTCCSPVCRLVSIVSMP